MAETEKCGCALGNCLCHLREETYRYDHKKQARMLFNMHLGVKDMFRPKRLPGHDYYQSKRFLDGIQYLGALDMDEGDRIAWSYPNYEFVVHFGNGDLVLFSTEGRSFQLIRIMSRMEKEEFLFNANPENLNMETYWEQMNRVIFIPDTEMVWGAPL